MTRGITDSHCHVWWDRFDEDRDETLDRAREAGVERMVVVGTDAETSRASLELARTREGLYGTAGLHPHEAARFDASTREAIAGLCAREDCVAVGETGLDWFKEWAPRDQQLASFRWHLQLARDLDKPVIIHSRDAHEDTLSLVQEAAGVRGVMHCFVMGPEELPHYTAAGLHVSFSGIVTFKGSAENQEAARRCPEELLLVETDAPFLAPTPHRGKRNEPAFCADTLRFVAELRGVSADHLARASSENAARLFGLPPLTLLPQ